MKQKRDSKQIQVMNDIELYNLDTNESIEQVFKMNVKDFSKFGFFYDLKRNESCCCNCDFSYPSLIQSNKLNEVLSTHVSHNSIGESVECELKEGHNRYLNVMLDNNWLDEETKSLSVISQFLNYQATKRDSVYKEYFQDHLASTQDLVKNLTTKAMNAKVFTKEDFKTCLYDTRKMSVIKTDILKNEASVELFENIQQFFDLFISNVPNIVSNAHIYNLFGQSSGINLEKIL